MRIATTKLYNWATSKANSKYSFFWIGLLFLLEIVLFIPLDAVLMFFCLQNKNKTFHYVLIAALASAASASAGYFLGHLLWDFLSPYIVPHCISTTAFDRMSSHFQLYENWAVFFGALLPFPLKLLSIAAGAFHLGFAPFIICFVAARLLRGLLVGGAMFLWGNKVKSFIDKHFHRLILLIGAKIACALAFFWALAR